MTLSISCSISFSGIFLISAINYKFSLTVFSFSRISLWGQKPTDPFKVSKFEKNSSPLSMLVKKVRKQINIGQNSSKWIIFLQKIYPLVGIAKPVIMLTIVVLPAPLWPSRLEKIVNKLYIRVLFYKS